MQILTWNIMTFLKFIQVWNAKKLFQKIIVSMEMAASNLVV